MSGYGYVNGQTSVILRVKLNNSSATSPTNAGVTGLTSSSTGLIISTIADNEATATVYTSAASHIGTITTLGTYSAPAASSCNFKEIDSTNHPGMYELQLANTRFAVPNAKSLLISFPAVAGLNLAQMDLVIPLTVIDPYNPRTVLQTQMSGSAAIGALGQRPTPEQCLMDIRQFLYEMNYSGTTGVVKDVDHATTIRTVTLNSAATPTTIVQSG